MSRILVTGAGGFIGYHLVNYLKDVNNHIVCVDNFSRIPKDYEISLLQNRDNIEWIEASVEDINLLSISNEPFDYIFHLATLNGTDNFYSKPFQVIKSVVLPTIHLLEELSKQQTLPKCFFLASTSEVYASMTEMGLSSVPTPESTPIGVDNITNLRWSYAAGKIAAESALISAARELNLNWVIGRYHNVYGPRMGDKHFIPDFITRVKKQEYFLYGAEQTRSFTFISDAIDQTVRIVNNPHSVNQIINIGSDNEVQIRVVADIILRLLKIEKKIMKEFPAPLGSVNRRVPQLDLVREIIGQLNHVPLEEGLRQTIRWYENHVF